MSSLHSMFAKGNLYVRKALRKLFLLFLNNGKNYKMPYIISYVRFLIERITQLNQTDKLFDYDLVFIIDNGNKGWILDAICKEIGSHYEGNCSYVYANYWPGKNISSHTMLCSQFA